MALEEACVGRYPVLIYRESSDLISDEIELEDYLFIDKKTIFAKDEIDRQSYQEHSFLVQTVQGKQAFRFRVCID